VSGLFDVDGGVLKENFVSSSAPSSREEEEEEEEEEDEDLGGAFRSGLKKEAEGLEPLFVGEGVEGMR